MSIIQKIMETVVQFVPDKEPDPLIQHKHGYVGKPFSRVDGQLKVKGEATFAAEFKLENVVYAAIVYSNITKGKITKIDSTEAEKANGFVAVITHENAPKMNKVPTFDGGGNKGGSGASTLPPMQDTSIFYNGQPVAVVVAETQDQAEFITSLVRVEYEIETAEVSFEAALPKAKSAGSILGEPAEVKIGDAEKALEKAEYKVDNLYRTPRYNHNAIEPHPIIAFWDKDDGLVVFEASQFVSGGRDTLAEIFGVEAKKVHVFSPFVGGGFGGKGTMWDYNILCVAAAKIVERPVKMVLSREGVFRLVGGRTPSEQRAAIGAEKDGKFVSVIHDGTTATTEFSAFQAEQFTFPVRHLYSSENFYINQKIVNLDTVPNTFMRAPGESIGTFALESAIDELAYKLKIDPVELRKINEPEKDPTNDREFSHRAMVEAFRRGAEKFGWNWNGEIGSQKDGKWLIGQGVATAIYPYYRMPAKARVRISADGRATISASAHEMGMGTATVQIQHAAERLGLPIDRVSFEYGNSDLPDSPVAGGSNQTASIAAAITAATEQILKEFLAIAGDDYDSPLANLKVEDVEMRDGGIFSKADSSKGETYLAILDRVGQTHVEAETAAPTPTELLKYSMFSYGAQFCEARVHEETGETRISRFLGSFDCGKILNPKTATSQFRGGIIMGIGMALTEETLFDERYGRIMNPSLAEYHVPVHLDIPKIDIIYNDIPDKHTPLGAHGIGEIGITGVAAAIANAIYNATGKRVRELPITLDKLM